jgi:hypothetical protein
MFMVHWLRMSIYATTNNPLFTTILFKNILNEYFDAHYTGK